jgi:hypothetical protein
MTTRIKFWLLSLSTALVVLQSCKKDPMDEPGTVYTGPTQIEFAHLTGTQNRVVVYTTASPNVMTDSVKIQLIGPQRSTPTTVNFTVDAAGTTGVAGTDYVNLTTTTNSVVIPANASFAWVVFRFTRPATGSKTLKLTLTGGEDVVVAENYKNMTFTWRR